MKTRLLCVWCKRLLIAGVVVILVSCDGGIFGTGDGDIDSTVGNMDAGSSESQPPAGTELPIDGMDQPDSPDAQPGDPDDEAQAETRSFENLLIGSNRVQPMISLVNLSAVPLNVITGANVLFPDAIQPDTNSDYASITQGSTPLSVVASKTSDPLLILSPLNLGAYSVSTLIARDRLITELSEQTSPGTRPEVDIIAIASQQLPIGEGVAQVRLLQASPLDAEDTPARMSLVPAGGSPGGSEVDLGVLSAANFGTSSDYDLVTPGTYRLVDSLERFSPLSVVLTGGESSTLILTGFPVNLRLLSDSQTLEPSAAELP